MTGTRSDRHRRAARRAREIRKRLTFAAAGALAVGAVSFSALVISPAGAGTAKLTGAPVPQGDLPVLFSAALSCPALTPPRLAAQVMAASGFDPAATGTDGQSGIAGLSAVDWAWWHPTTGADRGDRHANIVALAHSTCALIGKLRSEKVPGDLWQAAIAAQQAGFADTVAAHGKPAAAQAYVDEVVSYADWYAKSTDFTAKAGVAQAKSKTSAKVPDTYTAAIRKAGAVCETVTPARIAAQLLAMSDFDANRRSADGGLGIAQFTPTMWAQYNTSTKASVWNPADAIPLLGKAMCDLVTQVQGLTGDDPYTLALGAYQWGVYAVRQLNGLPKTNLAQLSSVTQAYVPLMEQDSRLRPAAAPEKTKAPEAKPASALPTDGKQYRIRSPFAKAVVELTGTDTAGAIEPVDLRTATGEQDQLWRFDKADSDGYWVITNVHSGAALAIGGGAKNDGASVAQLFRDPADPGQQWALDESGSGQITITNRASGKLLDIFGNDAQAPNGDGTWDGAPVDQWTAQPASQDQKWVLVQ